MNKPHKHRDVIIAWANGEEIEWRQEGIVLWQPTNNVPWALLEDTKGYEYRIKPKIVKKEGWVNIAKSRTDFDDGLAGYVTHAYRTKEAAQANKGAISIATIRIEWEEEL